MDHSSTHLASYAYTLDFAGHRTGVTELSGRTVTYAYDNIYRLTTETIASDPNSLNGTVGYTLDSVGNRTALTSTLTPVPAATWSYDANDRFSAGDSYDSNGNTTASGGLSDVYDFENHLIQQGGVTIVYDGDGNRVSKTVAGVTTSYLVDDVNPTGYAQVLQETVTGASGSYQEVSRSYVYGLERISQRHQFELSGTPTTDTKYYLYDGHGSVRALADSAGTVTDTYDYDAFGVLIHSTGTTPNNYLYSGEQYDPDLHLYYNRARYLNVSTGRFWSMDTFEGSDSDPLSLHKYLYAGSDPANNVDPSGHFDFSLAGVSITSAFQGTIFGLSTLQSSVIINGVVGALIASSTAGIGAYLEGQSPDQIEAATGNLYNIAIGTLIGIAGGFAGAYRVGRFVMTALAIGGGGNQARQEYKAGHTGAAFYYATLSLLAAGLINIVPALAKDAAFLGASDAPPAGPQASSAGEIVLFRGVGRAHPGYNDALQGIANPRGGSSSPIGHVLGNTNSSFTSWTADPSVAGWPEFAGEDGAVIAKVFRLSDLIQSSSLPDYPHSVLGSEAEYLVRGPVSGAVVIKK